MTPAEYEDAARYAKVATEELDKLLGLLLRLADNCERHPHERIAAAVLAAQLRVTVEESVQRFCVALDKTYEREAPTVKA
jgi:hypothetical protein